MGSIESYHGIIINVSQRDKSILRKMQIIGVKKAALHLIKLYKVEVKAEEIEDTIKSLQQNLSAKLLFKFKNFYFHFYRNDELIVVFRDRIFRLSTDRSTWDEVIQYGISLGIPDKQLDFFPCRIEDEEY